MTCPPALLSTLLPALLTLQPATGADDLARTSDRTGVWTQWRGSDRDGVVPGSGWPADLTEEHLSLAWRIEDLGPSYSGPIVDAKRVYTTETLDEALEVVRAFDRNSGEQLWEARWEGSMEVPFFAARNGSWIRSTPAVDEASLYVAGIRDVLNCLDIETGELRWSVDFAEVAGDGPPPFGCVCSPLVTDEHLYMQAGGALVKLDKRTGDVLWRTMVEANDMMSRGAFSSPVLAELHGRPQLVAQSRTELAGIDPDDGRTLWSTPVKSFRGMNILTPTLVGDAVFTSAYGGRSHLFEVLEDDGEQRVKEAWNIAEQAYMSSPVVVDGHAYMFLKSNRFGCIDLSTGQERWTSGPTRDSYWSLAVQGDRILALADTGTLRLIVATPSEYKVLSERDLTSDETWAHVAPAGEQIFVREQESLVAYQWK